MSGDLRLAGWLTVTLEDVGWAVATEVPPAGDHLSDGWRADLVLTDVRPRDLGETWTDEVRRSGAVIVVVTPRTVDGEPEAALAAGADGFIQCPVGSHELVARLRAVVRRRTDVVARRTLPPKGSSIQLGPLVLDRRTGILELGGVPLHLQRSELDVLEALMVAAPGVLTREELMRTYRDGDPGTATLDVVVRRLRGRLEEREGWRRIDTVRGVGFRLLEQPTMTMADRAIVASEVPGPFTSASDPNDQPLDLDRQRVSP